MQILHTLALVCFVVVVVAAPDSDVKLLTTDGKKSPLEHIGPYDVGDFSMKGERGG